MSLTRWHIFSSRSVLAQNLHRRCPDRSIAAQRPPDAYNSGNLKTGREHEADQFIPVRKEDLFSALIKQGDLADPAQRELFRRFVRTLRTVCHYEYSETLDRLRDDYYYFNPEVAGHAAVGRAKSEYAYDDLIRSLDKVLKDANFDELPHEDVADAHRKRTVPVEVKAKHDDFREVRFYKRGRHVVQLRLASGSACGGGKLRSKCSTTSCFWWR
jgi:hypothetical protein